MKPFKIPKHIWFGVLVPIVLVGLGTWRMWPRIVEYRYAEERATMKALLTVQGDEWLFMTSKMNTKGSESYWSGDVAGLNGNGHQLTIPELAKADGAPLNPVVPQPVPYQGYLFLALLRGSTPGKPADHGLEPTYDGHEWHLEVPSFGFCAYPAEYDWRHRRTFIVTRGKIWSVDNGGSPVTTMPSDTELAENFSRVSLFDELGWIGPE